LNKSCIMMLSALLQGYVEETFLYASRRLFSTLRGDDLIKRYRGTYFRWGNPSHENIRALFQRLGIDDVFDGLSWQNASRNQIAVKLKRINEIRNKIAHGQQLPEALSLPKVRNLREFADQFGRRFAAHVRGKLPR
jgi:hypothetical protein